LETKQSFDGKLYQKLSKSDNRFSSYSQKCQGRFLRHSVVAETFSMSCLSLNLLHWFICWVWYLYDRENTPRYQIPMCVFCCFEL